MKDVSFHFDVSVDDETGAVRAAYLRLRRGAVADTREVVPGRAFADYDADGLLLGVEFLVPCTAEVLDQIPGSDLDPVRKLLRGGSREPTTA